MRILWEKSTLERGVRGRVLLAPTTVQYSAQSIFARGREVVQEITAPLTCTATASLGRGCGDGLEAIFSGIPKVASEAVEVTEVSDLIRLVTYVEDTVTIEI
ncbi:MAG: hypothetical protein DDT26_02664 [Dehalococcoidia bacterium]|nr:hypothetical protein [Chloroflexota bacterium]